MHAIMEAPNVAIAKDLLWPQEHSSSSSHGEASAEIAEAAGPLSSAAAGEGASAGQLPTVPELASQQEEERPMADAGLFTMHIADPLRSGAAAAAAAGPGRRRGVPSVGAPLGPGLRGRLWVKHQVAAHNLQVSRHAPPKPPTRHAR